ncbi:MAG: hypothetical protein COS94_00325 [Candidatus Hydrogenedentes bacterium CG07_land_8_20_14_0_80_42_17]|nr:MAG: hypothetical protein COS94_00325 [Candidatus Hydrogenedentes bacterium CG07_land_8_20_14_0_80_42_17]
MNSRVKNILVVTPTSKLGGAERNIGLLAEHMPRESYKLFLATFFGTGDLINHFQKLNYEAKEFNYSKNLFEISHFFKFAKNIQPDIIHSFLLRGNWTAWALKQFPWAKGIPWIASERGLDITRPNWKAEANRFFLKPADLILAVSEPVKKILVERDKIESERIEILNGGVPSPLPPLNPPEEWLKLKRPRVVTLSHLRNEKNVELSIQAFAKSIKRGAEGSLTLIGEGPERKKLEKMVENLGLSSFVAFAGNILEARRMLHSFDLLLLPSKEEGFPNVILEAWQAGLPVLSTDTPGAREISGDENSAMLAKPETIHEELHKLMVSESERKLLAEKGKKRVKDFSIDRVVKKLDSIYSRICKD